MADLPIGIKIFDNHFVPHVYKPVKKVVEHIPLPSPRPTMEEVVHGKEHIFDWNIPLPDMAEIDLSYPKVGLDYLLQPWYWLERNLSTVETTDWLILSLAILGIYSFVRLAMWFDLRYRKNNWLKILAR